MKAIKNWVLEKEGFCIEVIVELSKNGIEVVRETEKAALVRVNWLSINGEKVVREFWIPKSAMCEEWERKFSMKAINHAYRGYIVRTAKDAYRAGKMGETRLIKSGRNVYDDASFYQQYKTTELKEMLDRYAIEYKTRDEYLAGLWN